MIQVIIFSKNRPWQLKECIRTFLKYACEEDARYHFKINVIISADEKTRMLYNLVERLIDRTANFYYESENTSFNDILKALLSSDEEYLLFMVDDLLWYDNFSLDLAMEAVACNYKSAYSFRLNDKIINCHPAQRFNQPDPITHTDCRGYKYYYLSQNPDNVDFRYPMEVSASLYWKNSIKQRIENLDTIFKNPNHLEASLSQSKNISDKHLFAPTPCCCIVTVNRVQDDYNNPVYNSELSLKEVNDLLFSYREFDDEAYSSIVDKTTIHVSDFVLNVQ